MIRLLFAALALLALSFGCATGGYYPSTDPDYPFLTDLPPSFYNGDPTLRHWYTAPYWDPTQIP
ncbi:MAG: hypothetical protein HY790_06970 [Deltaproteobacteria bacterium]|nr:hypothetical protein [Deltaproteobacteria bacterium]MBI4795567.1 hypothetical protein [Deltaproteobacteria bacterium]